MSYDTVWFSCPRCGKALDVQSRRGDDYYNYTLLNVPVDILSGLHEDTVECRDCGIDWTILVQHSIAVLVQIPKVKQSWEED